jgi:hypothetical protein
MKVQHSEDSLNGSAHFQSDDLFGLRDLQGSLSSLSLGGMRSLPTEDKRTQLPASLFSGQKRHELLLSKSKLVDYGIRPAAGSKSMTDLNAPFTTLPGLTPPKSTFSLAETRGRTMSSMVNAKFSSKRRTTNSHRPKSVRSTTSLDLDRISSARSSVTSCNAEDREKLTQYVDKALQEINKIPDAKEKEVMRGRSVITRQRLSASCNGTSPTRPKTLSDRGRSISLGDALTSSFRSSTLSPKPFSRMEKPTSRSRSGSRPRMYDPEKMIQSVDNALSVFGTPLENEDASTTKNNEQWDSENPEIKFKLKTSIVSPKRASDPIDEMMRTSRREKLIDMLEMDEVSKPDLNRDSLCSSFRAVSAAGMIMSKSSRGNSSPDLFGMSQGDDKDYSRRRKSNDRDPMPMPQLSRSRSAPFEKADPQRSFQALAALAGKSNPFQDSTLSFVSTAKHLQEKAEFNALAALSGKVSVSSKRSSGILSGSTDSGSDNNYPAATPVPASIATLKRNESFMSGASSIASQSQKDPFSPMNSQFHESMIGKELSIRAFPPPLPKTSLNRARSAPLKAGARSSLSPTPFQPKTRSGSSGMLSLMDDSMASLSFLKEDRVKLKAVRRTSNSRSHLALMIQTSMQSGDLLGDDSVVEMEGGSARRRPMRRSTSRESMLDASMNDGSTRRRTMRRVTSRDSLLDGSGFDVNAMALRRTTMRRVTSATGDLSCVSCLGSGPPISSNGRHATVRRAASIADAGGLSLASGSRRRNASGVGLASCKPSSLEQGRSNANWQSEVGNNGRNSAKAVGKSNAVWESKGSFGRENALQRVVTIR